MNALLHIHARRFSMSSSQQSEPRQAEAFRPEAVLFDLGLPGMDG
jgi:DNA-binding response OmpR family regulator